MLRRAVGLFLWVLVLCSASTPAVEQAAYQPNPGWANPACSNTTIPAGVSATANETPLGLTCTIKANTLKGGEVLHLTLKGVYNSVLGETAIGRVHYTQAGTLSPTTDATPITTGSISGIAGQPAGSEWTGDVTVAILAGATSMDLEGTLVFQASTPAIVMIGNVVTYSIDPTKDLTFYPTVKWGSNASGDYMQLRQYFGK